MIKPNISKELHDIIKGMKKDQSYVDKAAVKFSEHEDFADIMEVLEIHNVGVMRARLAMQDIWVDMATDWLADLGTTELCDGGL